MDIDKERVGIRKTYAFIIGWQAIIILGGVIVIHSPRTVMIHVLTQGFIMYLNTLVMLWKIGRTHRAP